MTDSAVMRPVFGLSDGTFSIDIEKPGLSLHAGPPVYPPPVVVAPPAVVYQGYPPYYGPPPPDKHYWKHWKHWDRDHWHHDHWD